MAIKTMITFIRIMMRVLRLSELAEPLIDRVEHYCLMRVTEHKRRAEEDRM